MCLAVPGKIISIDNSNSDLRMAKVQFGEILRDICIQWVDVEEGDYIISHIGTALTKLDEAEALETLKALREMDEF